MDQQVVGPPADLDLALVRIGLAALVEGHHHCARAVLADESGVLEERLLALFQADRVGDAFALHALEPGFDHAPFRAVDHDRDARDVGLGHDQVEERCHGLFAVDQAFIEVDVDDVGPVLHLLAGDGEGGLEVAFLDQLCELGRSGDVGALADDLEGRRRRPRRFGGLCGLRLGRRAAKRQKLKTAEVAAVDGRVALMGLRPLDDSADGGDVLGGGAAAAAQDVDPAVVGELADGVGELAGRHVVSAKRIWQTRVRVATDPGLRDAAHGLDIRAHLVRPEGAVDAHADQRRAMNRGPEGFDGLPAQGAPALVGDGG